VTTPPGEFMYKWIWKRAKQLNKIHIPSALYGASMSSGLHYRYSKIERTFIPYMFHVAPMSSDSTAGTPRWKLQRSLK
jgi:hypothetical protein